MPCCPKRKRTVARCGQSTRWIVDPLDGTREFIDRNGEFSGHVALAINGLAAVGAVALPGLGVTLTSGTPLALQPVNNPLKMLVSRTRPAAEAVFVAERIGAELLAMGSAGAKAMAVVLRRSRHLSSHRRPI